MLCECSRRRLASAPVMLATTRNARSDRNSCGSEIVNSKRGSMKKKSQARNDRIDAAKAETGQSAPRRSRPAP